MSKVYIFLADGFETVEALAPIDIMRRAGIEVVTVSIMGRKEVVSAQDITVTTDKLYNEVSFDDADALILPGGGTGTEHLLAYEPLHSQLIDAYTKSKLIAAICAAPMVLGKTGILKGRKATCYPGCEEGLIDAEYTATAIEQNDNVITACGPGVSFDFGFAIVEYLCGKETVATLRSQMQFNK